MRTRGPDRNRTPVALLSALMLCFATILHASDDRAAPNPSVQSPHASATTSAAANAKQLAQDELMTLAPYAVQIVNLAKLDPHLAAGMFPESWIDLILSGAIDIEAEVPEKAAKIAPPVEWPIGPWATPTTLADTIESLDASAVAALYRALRPRLTTRCQRLGATPKACGRALRTAITRLSASEIQSHAAGRPVPSGLTATQLGLSGLGAPVVVAVRDQLQSLGSVLWDSPRRRAER